MAALAHLGFGLAAKGIAPKIPVGFLILAAWVIDAIWTILFVLGVEHSPGAEVATTNPWSHGLFMSVIWSALAAAIAYLASRRRRMAIVVGLLVFSHWAIDAITHPMTAAFPEDTKLSLLFDGSPTIGFGLYGTDAGVAIGEYGTIIIGAAFYIFALLKMRKEPQAQPISGPKETP